ncbi:hypothetical protein Sjap_022856 [Stephania japonica]|uniref:Uncharacterized protein n=1 Tax=Stephania japonica TaxID=461633 RepID=A0AAP0EYG2_9MAGN
MEVEEVSVEVIKPSTPTPSHLKTHNLSLIDQYIAHAYLSVPLFYSSPAPTNTTQPSHILTHLRSSLSKTLTLFYPLAGRLNDPLNPHIHCNDEGVKFVHARVRRCTLSQALAPPDHRLDQLFPKQHTTGDQLLGIQVTFFDCGGFAIGVYFSHKIFDARSLCTFVSCWASIGKIGESVAQQPRFDSASIFPAIDPPPTSSALPDFAVERVVFKVFRFEGSKIEFLKAKAKGSGDERPPSRVMAVSALLWMVFAAMDGEKHRPCQLAMAVSLRGRLRTELTDSEAPIFHEHTIGNAALLPFAPPMAPSRDLAELPGLVKVLNDMVRRIDESDLVRRRDGREITKIMESYFEAVARDYASSDEGESGLYEIASWLRLPFYEADFGWGKPLWFGYLIGAFKNIITLLDTKCGEGVDVWVWMTEEDMARFESMPELLEFATPLHNALDH